jgi:hypothetical protein
MAQPKPNQAAYARTEDSRWAGLYKVGGVATVISAVLIPISIIAYFIWPTFPGNARDIFELIQDDRLAGIMSLDFLYLVGNFVAIPIFLSLYITLKRASESWSAIALALGFVGLVCIIPARPIMEMLSLSDQYAAATTEAQRALFLAAGEATLALFEGTAFKVHYVLGAVSLLISSILMGRSDVYSKATATVGILANTLVFWPLCANDRRLPLDHFRLAVPADMVDLDRPQALPAWEGRLRRTGLDSANSVPRR